MKNLLTIPASLSLVALLSFLALPACSQSNRQSQQAESAMEHEAAMPAKDLSGLSTAYFASGCFWCVEAVFESVRGVEEAVSGYAGGKEKNPTYEQVSAGATGHAEAVEVYYDPEVVDFATLVKVFFGSQDPTTLNRQGPDRGTQYRSIAFYQTEEEKAIINSYIEELYTSGAYDRGEIVTEVTAFTKFWPAEEYHQNYERRNPNQPYVRSVSIPRLRRFQQKYPELLKETH